MRRMRLLIVVVTLPALVGACSGGGGETTATTTTAGNTGRDIATTAGAPATTAATTTTYEPTSTTRATTTTLRTDQGQTVTVDVSPATDRAIADLGYELYVWSPDGSYVFATGESEVCILSTFGVDDRCYSWEGDVASPSWSADSSRVAFTENMFVEYKRMQEPDVWVLDAGEGTLTNWTDDGYSYDERYRGSLSDILPAWIGGDIVFVRFDGLDWSLERIGEPVGSGATAQTCRVPNLGEFANGPIPAGNGSVGVTVGSGEEYSFEVCHTDGSTSAVELERDADRGRPTVAGVLPDGRMVLRYVQFAGSGGSRSSTRSAMDIVSAEGDDHVEVLAPDADPSTPRVGPSLLLVNESGDASAVVMGVGTAEGYSDTPWTGLVFGYDLGRMSIDPLTDTPLWSQAGLLSTHSATVPAYYQAQHTFRSLGPGDGAVILMVDGPEERYYRISFGPQQD